MNSSDQSISLAKTRSNALVSRLQPGVSSPITQNHSRISTEIQSSETKSLNFNGHLPQLQTHFSTFTRPFILGLTGLSALLPVGCNPSKTIAPPQGQAISLSNDKTKAEATAVNLKAEALATLEKSSSIEGKIALLQYASQKNTPISDAQRTQWITSTLTLHGKALRAINMNELMGGPRPQMGPKIMQASPNTSSNGSPNGQVDGTSSESEKALNLLKASYTATSAIQDNTAKLEVIQSFGKESLLQIIQPGLQPLLLSFEKEAKNPEFQLKLGSWIKALSSGKANDQAMAAYLLGVQTQPRDPATSQLIFQDSDLRLALLKPLLLSGEGAVQQAAMETLMNTVALEKWTDSQKETLLQDVFLNQSTIPLSAPLLQTLKSLSNDEKKMGHLQSILNTQTYPYATQLVDGVADVLSTVKTESIPQRNALITILKNSQHKPANFMGTFLHLAFPDHPEAGTVMRELIHHKKPEVIKIASGNIGRVQDVATRKAMTTEMLHYGETELAGLQKMIDEANQKALELDDLVDPPKDSPKPPLSEAEREKVLKQIETLYNERDKADARATQITEIMLGAVNSLSSYKESDPQFQKEQLNACLERPEGRLRFMAAKQIAHVKNDADKAAFILKMTDIAGNAKFYDQDPKALPGTVPFLVKEGHTPFESIATEAAATTRTISSDAIKIDLIQKLSKHPVIFVKSQVLQALPTIQKEHENLISSIDALVRTPYKGIRDELQRNLEQYPQEALSNLLKTLSQADLNLKEDSNETGGYGGRVLTGLLLPKLGKEYDAQKKALLIQGSQDRLPMVRYAYGMAGLPLQDTKIKTEVVQAYLDSQDPFFNHIALQELQQQDGLTVKDESILKLLNHSEPVIRSGAARLIHRLDPVTTSRSKVIQNLLSDKDPTVKGALAESLLKTVVYAEELQKLCQDQDPLTRTAVASALSKTQLPAPNQLFITTIGRDEYLKLLKVFCQDGDINVRISVAPGLNQLADEQEKQGLLKTLMTNQPEDVQLKILSQLLK
ncbi:MAG: HEAT repeat domain-containing protein [Cyanobacteria bacterium]|nr:HEAT repeat domain-containing protein [Cyanobacteriota bacterium]